MNMDEKTADPGAVDAKIQNVHGESPMDRDAVFGEITDEGPNYRSVGWLGTAALMMKAQIGLGVLSIPASFDTLGLVPGVICLIAIAGITTWSNVIVGDFKVKHREVYGIDDAAGRMFGRVGRELLGVTFILYLIFVSGSGMLGISIALNAISDHGACTAIFVAVAAIVVFPLGSIRTLGRISWLAWIGLVSLLTAIFIVAVAVGVQNRPDSAPKHGPWISDYKLVNYPNFTEAISAVATFIFAYAATPLCFPLAAEMRNPHHYRRSVFLSQGVVTAVYLAIAAVVYYYCGSYVASPALGSAGRLIKKVSYGIALPGLFVGCTLCTHLSGKYFFVRILRGSKHISSNSFIHWATWLGCVFAVIVIAYVIASGIPVFGDLVSLIGAFLGTFQCFQPIGCMWFYDNWADRHNKRTVKWVIAVCWAAFVILAGTFLMVAGTYGSVVGIATSIKENGGTSPWSCADNSNSV